MEDNWPTEKINDWVKGGIMTKSQIMARLDSRVQSGYAIGDDEKPVLDKIFGPLNSSDVSRAAFLSESAFIDLVHTKIALPRSVDTEEACKIIYESIAYLSTVPFPINRNISSQSERAVSPPSQGLSRNEVMRGLTWALPDRYKYIIEEGPDSCHRTEGDHTRLIFQSLAISYNEEQAHNSRPASQMKRDGDEDEIYEDLLDVLYSTQEIAHPRFSPVHRDNLRLLAARLSAESNLPSLMELGIPIQRFEALVKVLLALQFQPPAKPSDFTTPARAVTACFTQNGADTSVITWPMFERSIHNDARYLFAPLYRLLSTTFFDKSSTIDVLDASEAPASPPQDGKGEVILTRPLQSQLSIFLAASAYFGWLYRANHFAVTGADQVTPRALVSALQSVPDEAILVVSGKSDSGERCTFGLFSPRPREDGASIQTDVNPKNAGQERCALFQLEPVHNIFKGAIGRPGWSIDEARGSVAFGQGGGVSLVLEDMLRRAVFRHESNERGDGASKASYPASAWGGDWSATFDVTSIEIWSEREE
ncbi:hypothetical protein F4777DRAFT_552500 [Nemania sp. FL0916]|nr:hypothetical protein F4777DRAFT_552500 [Nemania sp. FL0916]